MAAGRGAGKWAVAPDQSAGPTTGPGSVLPRVHAGLRPRPHCRCWELGDAAAGAEPDRNAGDAAGGCEHRSGVQLPTSGPSGTSHALIQHRQRQPQRHAQSIGTATQSPPAAAAQSAAAQSASKPGCAGKPTGSQRRLAAFDDAGCRALERQQCGAVHRSGCGHRRCPCPGHRYPLPAPLRLAAFLEGEACCSWPEQAGAGGLSHLLLAGSALRLRMRGLEVPSSFPNPSSPFSFPSPRHRPGVLPVRAAAGPSPAARSHGQGEQARQRHRALPRPAGLAGAAQPGAQQRGRRAFAGLLGQV